MSYEVLISTALPRPLAAVRTQVKPHDIPKVIQSELGKVWQFFGEHKIKSSGHNVALYVPVSGTSRADMLLDTWFGVEVHETIPASETVTATSTPDGLVAATIHWGEYTRVGEAHDAVQAWCKANGRRFTGPCWEVYGDWFDDWAKVRTDVYYQLDDGS